MTKEEAILVLDNARPQTKEIDRQFYDDEDLNNALDMAIKALEQQTTKESLAVGDCVSRKAVFEAIDDCNSDGLKGIFCSYKDGERFKEYIKKLSPTFGICKDCKHLKVWRSGRHKGIYCGLHTEADFCFEVEENFYCAYFEKGGEA